MPIGFSNGKQFEDLYKYEEDKFLQGRDAMEIHPRAYTDNKDLDLNPNFDEEINKLTPFQYNEPVGPITQISDGIFARPTPMVAKPTLVGPDPEKRWDEAFAALKQSEMDTKRRMEFAGDVNVPVNATSTEGKLPYAPEPEKGSFPQQITQKFMDYVTDKYITANAGPANKRHESWAEKAVKEVGDAAEGLTSGRINPMTEEGIKATFDIASNVVLGPAAPAALGIKLADGTLGSFAGVKAAGIDKLKLDKARAMYANGDTADQIWGRTGFFKDKDGQWKFEISDEKAKMLPEANKLLEDSGLFTRKLPDVFKHDALFKAYPEFKNIEITTTMPMVGKHLEDINPSGVFFDDINTIYVNPKLSPDQQRSVILHELQHGVQQKEHFAKGGNENMFKSEQLAQAEQLWATTAEAELKAMADTGLDPAKLFAASDAINRQYRTGTYSPRARSVLDWAKDVGIYEKLDNIAHGGYLLDKAKAQRYENYKNLMGEVEARNVQTRMDYSDYTRKSAHPWMTEDTLAMDQIYFNSTKPGASASDNVIPIRKAANDNWQRIDREPEINTQGLDWVDNKPSMTPKDYIAASNKMHEYGTWLFSKTENLNDINLARYNKMRRELAEASGDEYIPIKHNVRGLDNETKAQRASREKADKIVAEFKTDLEEMRKKYPQEDFTPMIARKLKEWFKLGFPPPKLPLGPN